MSNTEKEQKPTQEVQKPPEIPEEAAREAAQATKESDAAAALVGAESLEAAELRTERKKLKDVAYLHVDDQVEVRDKIAKQLAEKFGMTGKAGEARSLEGAVAVVKKLAQEGKPLDLILLDRQFPEYDDDEITGEQAGDQFLQIFEELTRNPQFKDQLRNTHIIMMTSHAGDTETMARFQELSSRVIGGVGKVEAKDIERIKANLIEAGVIERDLVEELPVSIAEKRETKEGYERIGAWEVSTKIPEEVRQAFEQDLAYVEKGELSPREMIAFSSGDMRENYKFHSPILDQMSREEIEQMSMREFLASFPPEEKTRISREHLGDLRYDNISPLEHYMSGSGVRFIPDPFSEMRGQYEGKRIDRHQQILELAKETTASLVEWYTTLLSRLKPEDKRHSLYSEAVQKLKSGKQVFLQERLLSRPYQFDAKLSAIQRADAFQAIMIFDLETKEARIESLEQ